MADQTKLENYFLKLLDFLLLQKRVVVEIGSNYGLSTMQTVTLLHVKDPMPMHEISTAFNCDASNVTGIVDGLQKKDLAVRYENSDDRRIRMVKLQPKGFELRNQILKDLLKKSNPLFSNLNKEELSTLLALVDKVTKKS